jgi:hypothetical protein
VPAKLLRAWIPTCSHDPFHTGSAGAYLPNCCVKAAANKKYAQPELLAYFGVLVKVYAK